MLFKASLCLPVEVSIYSNMKVHSGFLSDDATNYFTIFSTPVQVFMPMTSTTTSKIIVSGVTQIANVTIEEFFPSRTARMTDVGPGVGDESLSSTKTITSAIALMEPLVVAWQFSDLSKFSTAYATSLAKRIGIDYTPPATPATSPTLPGEIAGSPSPDLTTGAKAGVGVGVAIFTFLLVISLIALAIHRRQRRRQRTVPTDSLPEMEHQERSGRWYTGGIWRGELRVKNMPSELESTRDPDELETMREAGELDSRSLRSPVELDAAPGQIPPTI